MSSAEQQRVYRKRKSAQAIDVAQIGGRFWTWVNRGEVGECWPWAGYVSSRGYGNVMVQGRQVGAHRLAWMVVNGSIPPGLIVCHRCDNPLCVNPLHLFLGTQRDNMGDASRKGRIANSKKTHCLRGHPFSASNTRVFTRPNGRVGRACRKCYIDRRRHWSATHGQGVSR